MSGEERPKGELQALYWRQLDVLPMDKIFNTEFTVIGAGALGKAIVMMLTGMGVRNLTVYDKDVVEPHNLPMQGYRPKDLGRPKVEALVEIVKEFTDIDITGVNDWFMDQDITEVTIIAVDSMDTRIELWDAINMKMPKLYIDMRMGAEVGQVFYVNPWSPSSKKDYKANLFPSEEAEQAPCTQRSTRYCAEGLCAFVAGGVANYLRGEALRPLVLDFRTGMVIDMPKAKAV